ncbi:MAG: hypothetical protein EZS28_018293 [Streblomastix strix]|uniref:DDE-1 domain-containing protein n=1 Tax=Streblomastix strix TaxID=222440 RepID=A0A5J4VU64_9EUKA|nr:MAG: hypothetical protein EZS28_018293 [Streblomastix strix]
MRARNSTKAVIEPYFIKVGEQFSLVVPFPHMIGSLDEATISQIASQRRQTVSFIDQESYAQPESKTGLIGASIIPFVTADGCAFPTCVLIDSARVPEELRLHSNPAQLFFYPCTGWNTKAIFIDLFKNWIIPSINMKRESLGLTEQPFFLFLDGHRSRENEDLFKLADQNNIVLIFYPSHTTHLLQPCDNGIFGTLRNNKLISPQKIISSPIKHTSNNLDNQIYSSVSTPTKERSPTIHRSKKLFSPTIQIRKSKKNRIIDDNKDDEFLSCDDMKQAPEKLLSNISDTVHQPLISTFLSPHANISQSNQIDIGDNKIEDQNKEMVKILIGEIDDDVEDDDEYAQDSSSDDSDENSQDYSSNDDEDCSSDED